jgi:hypothetical protein
VFQFCFPRAGFAFYGWRSMACFFFYSGEGVHKGFQNQKAKGRALADGVSWQAVWGFLITGEFGGMGGLCEGEDDF